MTRNSAHCRTSRSRTTGSRTAPDRTAARTTRPSSCANPICWASVETPRSKPSRLIATFQPPPSPPTTCSTRARAPSKKTSLNSLVPVICRMGRTSTRPGWSMGTRRKVSPWCRCEPGSVRASTKHQFASWASDVQIFCPVIR